MPELPEIVVKTKQMEKDIVGKRISDLEVRQPKNLNVPVEDFAKTVKGKTITSVSAKGKWFFIKLNSAHYLLINLGMNADMLYFSPTQKLPEKYQFKLTFEDKSGFTIQFQWFGYIHLVHEKNLKNHKLTEKLGISPIEKEFTLEHFKELLSERKMKIKSFLLDQKNVAGIGNVYIQDILFKAKLHPNRLISSLSEKEVSDLYKAIKEVLNYSIQLGGLTYEKDFYGQSGKLTIDKFLVGYKPGKPCPICKTLIEKIRTGSTSTYICPKCQKI